MWPKRISILGVGLLGGSIGLAARKFLSACEIVGYGHRPATLQAALARGAVDTVESNAAAAVAGADLVILCTPVGLFDRIIQEISPVLSATAVVTDVGSTKRSVVELAGKHLEHPERFVGSHPMAGGEVRGVEFARADLFQEAVCITTPIAQTDTQVLAKVEQFWGKLGLRLTRLSPQDHDRLIGEISHVPHAVAAALVAMQDDAALPLCGKGFLDATRIAAGDGGLWRDIFMDNQDNLRVGIGRLMGELSQLLARMENGDAEKVMAWLDAAAARRAALVKSK